MFELIKYPEKNKWKEYLRRPSSGIPEKMKVLEEILSDVKSNGDVALRKFTGLFDGVTINEFQVSANEFADAIALVPAELKKAISNAKTAIEMFHGAQRENVRVVETWPGVSCWRKPVAIEKIGIYIPGGSAPLFSTVLMLGVPAIIAGCREVVMCTPPAPDGRISPAVLYAASLLGITKVFKAGGAQAIAAMAYGTESIPKVSKIFGPGNNYVTGAKLLVSQEGVAIDMPAGPSELAIFADDTCVPGFVAADLLSQAEHGSDSQVILVTDSEYVIAAVQAELEQQMEQLPRKKIIAESLSGSKIFLVNNCEDGLELLNAYAPEHLIIASEKWEQMVEGVINAGSVFLGNYAAESIGDYASGTNHTLPTNGYATAFSGLSLDSFVKKITYQKVEKEGLLNLGQTVEVMAEAEGLAGHRNAIAIRIKKIKGEINEI